MPPKFSAMMSRQASSDEIDVLCFRRSPESFCIYMYSAHFSQKGGSDIPKFIVTDGGISTTGPQEQLKACSTVSGLLQMHTKGSELRRLPAKTQANGISKISLVESYC